jgi:hypothetical protein
MSNISVNICRLIVLILLHHTALTFFIFLVLLRNLIIEYLLSCALFAYLRGAIHAIKGVMAIIN